MYELTADDGPTPRGWRRIFTEPRRPQWVRDHPHAPWLVVGTVCIGAFMGQLDASIVTLAVPSIQRDFAAPLASVEWVALAYLLVLVGSVAAVGRLSDVVGRKLLYTYGFGVFTAASLACALAPSMGWLIASRVVQALGAAMLQANSVALIRTSMPTHKLGRAIGLQGAAQAIGLAIGPSIGGLLIGVGGWRLVFFVNVPAGIIGLLLGWFLLPRTRTRAPRSRFDTAGVLLLLPAVAAMLFAFSQAASLGFANPLVLGLLTGAVVMGGLFVVHERRSASPLVDLKLFAQRSFSLGISTGLLSYLVLFGALFVTPLFLESAYRLPPAQAGLLLTILPVALGATAPLAGIITDRQGARLPTTAGMALTAAGFLLLTISTPTIPTIAIALTLAGLGLGLFTPANNSTVAAAGHDHQAGMVSGMLNMTRGIGTSLGVAVAGATYALTITTAGPHLTSVDSATAGLHAAMALLTVLAFLAAILSVGKNNTHPGQGARP
ncbi:MAG TPA: DHA2 family efflux MFS transporter permease subunit [Pseudolysinimonas sp.]|nr:DHA2 family efflux MFS transporter permease subunit [Pseudolysinimonas sp.]